MTTKSSQEIEVANILDRLKDQWGIAEIKLRGYILDLKQELADAQADLDGMKQNWTDAKEERDRYREALEHILKQTQYPGAQEYANAKAKEALSTHAQAAKELSDG